MPYSLPYVILISFILVIAVIQLGMPIEKKSRKYLNFLVVTAYLLFFGFRGYIGWDWYNYYPYFCGIKNINTVFFEPGFVLFVDIIKSISNSYQIFIFLNTLVNVLLLDIFLKRYLNGKYYALGFALFVALAGFTMEIDLLRNFKSLLLFMLSLKYIRERKILPFVILNVIAVSFHWSAILFFPLYFLINRAIPLKLFIAVFLVGNIVILFNVHYIKPVLLFVSDFFGSTAEKKIEYYVHSKLYAEPYEISVGYFVRFFTSILVFFYYRRLLEYSKHAAIFINSFFILIVAYLYFSEMSIIISRFAILFHYSIAILVPMLIQIIKPISTRIALLFIYFAVILARIYSSAGNIFYDYDNALLGKIKSYNERLIIYKNNYERLSSTDGK